jgi:NTP pyrophosphatase (non-canonical NTP hydrolase)
MSRELDPLVDDLINIYGAAKVKLPEPRAVALRLVEECIELVLATGASPADIATSIQAAMHNEHRKDPSMSFHQGQQKSNDEIADELADVSLLASFTQRMAGLFDDEVTQAAKSKVRALQSAQKANQLHFTDDRRFYRRPSNG